MNIILIGELINAVVGLFIIFKKLRSGKKILIVTGLSIPLALYAIIEKINGQPYSGHIRPTDTFLSPLVTILIYALFRYLYIKTFKLEPTYYRGKTWYDPVDGRQQNIFDIIVMITPFVIGGLFPILLDKV